MNRFTLRFAMSCVGVSAVALGMMKSASEFLANCTMTVLLFILLTAVLGAILSKGNPGWTGFAVFSCGYGFFAILADEPFDYEELPPQAAIIALADAIHSDNSPEPNPPKLSRKYMNQVPYPTPPLIVGHVPPGVKESENHGGNLYDFLCRSHHSLLDTSMLTPGELQTLKTYEAEVQSRETRIHTANRRNAYATVIGGLWMVVLVGLLGSVTGRVLADRFSKRPVPTTS